jgi:hypothetical protein
MVRRQVRPVPAQFPPQPPNVEPPVGAAVRVTTVPVAIIVLQVPVLSTPQAIPPTSLVTLPVPVPCAVTLREKLDGGLKVADAVLALSMVRVQATAMPKLEQSPPQPPNVEPPVGVAARVTDVPEAYDSLQSAPQLIPMGPLVTVPEPAPGLVTLRL